MVACLIDTDGADQAPPLDIGKCAVQNVVDLVDAEASSASFELGAAMCRRLPPGCVPSYRNALFFILAKVQPVAAQPPHDGGYGSGLTRKLTPRQAMSELG